MTVVVNPNIGTPTVGIGNVDVRLLQQMASNPIFSSSQPQATVSAAAFRLNSKDWTSDMRVVFDQVRAGYTDREGPPVTVDMTPVRWQGAFDALVDEGALINQ